MLRTSRPQTTPWLLPLMTLGLMAGILSGRMADMWSFSVAALLLAAIAAVIAYGWPRTLALVMCAAALGSFVSWQTYHPVLPGEGTYTITGVVMQDVRLRDDGQVQTTLEHVTLNGEDFSSGAYWTWYLDADEEFPNQLKPGAWVSFDARLYHPGQETNPDGFNFREYLLQRDITIGVYGAEALTFPDGPFTVSGSMSSLRHDLTRRLINVMGQETGAYAAAMLLGNRGDLPEEDTEAFRTLGISHILSVSGYHVGVLTTLLLFALKPFHMARKHRFWLQALLLTVYCLLTGGAAPVVRAALLLLLLELGRLKHRQSLPLHMLSATASIQLLFNPSLLTSASFQLTYGAMLGLMLIRPWLMRRRTFPKGVRNWLWQAVCSCLAAQIGILPAQLYWFGELPLLSLVLNLFVMSITSVVMAVYWLTLLLLWLPGVRDVLGWIAALMTGGLLDGVRWLGSLEGTTLWTRQADVFTIIGWMMVMTGLSVYPPKAWWKFRVFMACTGLALILTLLIPLPSNDTVYIQFDVGEEDAALINDHGKVIVIDVGEDGNALSGYLHKRRLGIDMLILSHLHTDHAGGLQAILDDHIPVAHCYLPYGALQAAEIPPEIPAMLHALQARGTEIHYLSRGDVLILPNGTLTCLWPDEGMYRPRLDANDNSLTLLADLQGVTLLLTGDLSGEYEQYAAVPADILKAAHHGSASSTSPAFLEAVEPSLILLSCGNEDREISMQSRSGSLPLYSTNTHGALTLTFEDGSCTIQTYLPYE